MLTRIYGIATRSQQGLHLVARIARRSSGIYYLVPRDAEDFDIDADSKWNPHASYHADGRHHVKSFGQPLGDPVYRQPLTSGFGGAEPLFAQSFQPGELRQIPPFNGTADFADIFAIPIECIDPTAPYAIAVDLLAPGASRLAGPWLTAERDHSFADAQPIVHVTLWRGIAGISSL